MMQMALFCISKIKIFIKNLPRVTLGRLGRFLLVISLINPISEMPGRGELEPKSEWREVL
jgi:hypothetical protein